MKHTSIIVAIGLALAIALTAAPAEAQLQHTFVSSQGLDTNNCSLATPCRHLQAALAGTTAGGEIGILDTAGYNGGATVTITQAVSIVVAPGVEAEIAPPSGGFGIVINAGANDAVSLRGLTIDGGGVGATGIRFNSGASLTVEDCVIRQLTADGIGFFPNSSSNILVSNTRISDGNKGIQVNPNGGTYVNAVFNRVEAINNAAYGIVVNGSNFSGTLLQATASDCLAAYNGVGFEAISNKTGTYFMLSHVVATNNDTGIELQSIGTQLIIAQSTVTWNNYGYRSTVDGAEPVISYGDNYMSNWNNAGAMISTPKQ